MSDTPETDLLVDTLQQNKSPVEIPALIGHAMRMEAERNTLHAAIKSLRDAKGRFHTQQAAERLFKLIP